ncbi:TolC family protein [Parapedobacter lycopersici]|uniref:TolC family protein n=1 Tax=Parapedobacter lycopersici TaxID=1864939 RepID=UPI00214DAB58|nr:TolC family protein [Parapedobacter lycopersici]
MKRYHLYSFTLISCLCLVFSAARSQVADVDTLSLEQCIALALQQNINAQQSRLLIEQAEIDRRQAWQNQLPSLNATLGHSLSQGRRIDPTTNQYIERRFTAGNQNISSSLTLFDGLGTLRNIRQQAIALQATEMENNNVQDQVKLDVMLAYVQLLTAQDMLKQAELNAAVTEQKLNQATIQHEKGAINPGDYYDLKGQYMADQTAVNDLLISCNNSRVALANLLNLPPGSAVEIRPLGEELLADPQPADNVQLYDYAVNTLPAIRAAALRAKEASVALKVARSVYFPSLKVGAGFESNYSGNENLSYGRQMQNNLGRYLQFTLSIPLLNGLTTRNNVARAKLAVSNAEYLEENQRNALRQQTDRAIFDLALAKDSYNNLVEESASFSASYRIAEIRFEAGDIDSVPFLIAKNKMDTTNARLLISKYEWIMRQLMIDYYSGNLQF